MQRVMLVMAALGLQAAVRADEPARKYRLVTPKDDGIVATGINGRGDVVGFEWLEEKERPGVVAQVPFFARGKTMIYLPLLAGFTATHPAAVSDTGLVVGRASKPTRMALRVHLLNQAFIWDEATGIHGLGVLKDDSASYACGVSRDGNRISGVSIGDNRVRACVWDRVGNDWKGTPLPQAGQLGSQIVVMSDNGRYVTSIDANVPCLWTRGENGSWAREVIGEAGTIAPRAVNNSGIVVGVGTIKDSASDAVIWKHGEGLTRLPRLAGYPRNEALAINNAGVVVGMIDGPHGSATGPNAFLYEKGVLRLMKEFGPAFTTATAINDAGQLAGVVDTEDADGAE